MSTQRRVDAGEVPSLLDPASEGLPLAQDDVPYHYDRVSWSLRVALGGKGPVHEVDGHTDQYARGWTITECSHPGCDEPVGVLDGGLCDRHHHS